MAQSLWTVSICSFLYLVGAPVPPLLPTALVFPFGWDDQDTRIEELIALVADHAVARAAFAEAVRRRPGRLIILRQKARVLADSRR